MNGTTTLKKIKSYGHGSWKAVSSYQVLVDGQSIGRVHQVQASRSQSIWTGERGAFRTAGFDTRAEAVTALIAQVAR